MIDTLRRVLPGRGRRRLDRPGRAAVLVPIIDDDGPRRLLLTRRTEELPSHQGQVAFPGGFVLAGETDPACTALREAEEEIGLPPERVEVLGLLDDFPTKNDTVAVTPVAGRIVTLPPLRPRPGEVARIFTIPVACLSEPGRWTSRIEQGPSGRRHIHFFSHDGEILWGLSARIVLHLLALTPDGAPVSLEES